MFTRDMIFGFVAGLVAGAAGYHYYRKNEGRINSYLAGKGINLPGGEGAISEGEAHDLESLVSQKERLEDLIAEQEAEAKA